MSNGQPLRHARAYYNEHDAGAAAWLRELIKRGLIADGDVDERSITEVTPGDVRGYTQCHFFAGIGGWSLALRLAGWPDGRPVWTGSCPCQPFSAAGKGLGEKDERHLWPVFFELIRQCRPEQVFGEQVASAIGKGWLDGVSADLEAEGYACGAVVLGAHSVGAPHLRQRLYWVADADEGQCGWRADGEGCKRDGSEARWIESHSEPEPCGEASGVADATGGGLRILGDAAQSRRGGHADGGSGDGGRVGDTRKPGLEGHGRHVHDGDQSRRQREIAAGSTATAGAAGERLGEPDGDGRPSGQPATEGSGHGAPAEPAGFWSDSRLILCRDGKLRRIPTEPALFPLADGLPYKLARRRTVRPPLLRGAGNAIVPQDAAAFIGAWLEVAQIEH